MSSTLVSIIVPCFNQAKYLLETVESVISQTYTNWECIIINDGSSDNTKEVALDLIKRDQRI
ncbi:MAG: glycosyltransferase family 2 protein, partial [Tissierellia bacterium]|nr:glycosyltransferase family 2 protein [Tissierellia bacterium]